MSCLVQALGTQNRINASFAMSANACRSMRHKVQKREVNSHFCEIYSINRNVKRGTIPSPLRLRYAELPLVRGAIIRKEVIISFVIASSFC